MRVKNMDFGLHPPSYCAIITLRNTQYMAISGCEKGESVMAEVKTIRQYRTKQDGNTLIEFPIVDEESKLETKLPNNSKQQNGAHHNTAVFNIQVFFQTE